MHLFGCIAGYARNFYVAFLNGMDSLSFDWRDRLILMVMQGSVPVRMLWRGQTWGGSSVGRASRSQRGGREFESPPLHPLYARLHSAVYKLVYLAR